MVKNGNGDVSEQEAMDDKEAELQLTRVDSADDFPGAFPHFPAGGREEKSDGSDRRALPTWISTAPTRAKKDPSIPSLPPPKQPTKSSITSTSTKSAQQPQPQTHHTRHAQNSSVPPPLPSSSASSTLKVPQQQHRGKPSSRASSKGRASSVLSDTGDDTNTATDGPVLRRSSRLSATPAPTSPERKNKKLRSSNSPPPGTAKQQQRKGRGSAPPPPGRRTRRQVSVLDDLDE